MKYIFFILLFLNLGALKSFGQGSYEGTFYLQNPMLINPAATGLSEGTQVFLTYQDQWTGFEGAPKTLQAGVHGTLKQKSGAGLLIKTFQWGVLDDNSATFSYAHQIDLSSEHKLRLGASAGFFQRKLNSQRLDMENPDDDIVVQNHYGNSMFMQVGFGALYRWNQWTVSLSTPELFDGATQQMLNSGLLLFSYQHKITGAEVKIIPSVLLKVNRDLPDFGQFSVQGTWKEMVWLQTGYKTNHSLMFSTGLNYDKLGFGYGFETAGKTVNNFSYGSHELLLTYQFAARESKDVLP